MSSHVSIDGAYGHGRGERRGPTRWYPRGAKPFFIRLRACHRPTKIQVSMRTKKPRKTDHLIMMPVCVFGQSKPVHGPVDDPAVGSRGLALECQKGTMAPSSLTHPGGSSSSRLWRRFNFSASIITVPTRGRGMLMTAMANDGCVRGCECMLCLFSCPCRSPLLFPYAQVGLCREMNKCRAEEKRALLQG